MIGKQNGCRKPYQLTIGNIERLRKGFKDMIVHIRNLLNSLRQADIDTCTWFCIFTIFASSTFIICLFLFF